MPITINLTPEQEASLQAEASARGLDLGEFARLRLLEAVTPAAEISDPGAKLREIFAQWNEEDAKRTPEENADADAGWKEVERSLAENPVTMRVVEVSGDV